MLCKIIQIARTMPFYAVRRGRQPGVYNSWPECEAQVKGFVGARYKKFGTENEAWSFANELESPNSGVSGASNSPAKPPAASYHSNSRVPNVTISSAASSGFSNSPAKPPAASYPSVSRVPNVTRASAVLSGGSTSAPTAVSSTRLLALKGTINNISQCVTQLQHFCTLAEQQVEQINSRKRKAGNTDSNAPATARPRMSPVSGQSARVQGQTVSDDGSAVVYTDGCCHNNGQPGATAGIGVYWGPGHHLNLAEKLLGKQTNNRAEIRAATRAAQQAKAAGITNLTIHTDSQFTINGITKWIHKWKKNGWKLASGADVINQADFTELDNAIEGLNVKWVYVRGHMGDPGNEAADSLANDGARLPNHS